MPALTSANSIRIERASDKRRIKARELSIADVLREPPRHWETALVIDLLTCVPRIGTTKANAWLHMERVGGHRRLRDLTVRQRYALASHYEAWNAGRVAA
jgi:hypothetical protein